MLDNSNPVRAWVGPVHTTLILSSPEERYRAALKSIRAYFIGGWPDDDDCARIWKLAEDALK